MIHCTLSVYSMVSPFTHNLRGRNNNIQLLEFLTPQYSLHSIQNSNNCRAVFRWRCRLVYTCCCIALSEQADTKSAAIHIYIMHKWFMCRGQRHSIDVTAQTKHLSSQSSLPSQPVQPALRTASTSRAVCACAQVQSSLLVLAVLKAIDLPSLTSLLCVASPQAPW